MMAWQELELSPVVAVNPSTGLGLEGDGQLRQKITGPVWYVGSVGFGCWKWCFARLYCVTLLLCYPVGYVRNIRL